MDDFLEGFSENTRLWLKNTFSAPTEAQRLAWSAIDSGCDVLVSSPTGTGKTLAAFLLFIDRLSVLRTEGKLSDETRVIYISPLKSLAADIRENLDRPLGGIAETAAACGMMLIKPTAAVRTGDTTARERAAINKKPPNILITTPESLYLMLSSVSGKNVLKTAEAVIIDELHALINTKRGTHLALSLARLDRLAGRPLRRIGLSATIKPLELAARWLSPRECEIIAPAPEKEISISIVSPFSADANEPIQSEHPGTVWPGIARLTLRAIENTKSAIAFVSARTTAEKLTYYVNETAGDPDFALAHHGSISKSLRLEAEERLRAGTLRLVCATGSLELGIDIGDIDVALQVGKPDSVSSLLQRLGRAGHAPGRVSQMQIIPREPIEALYCIAYASLARQSKIEPALPFKGGLDVLAQHLASMAATETYSVEDALAVFGEAYPLRGITRREIESVLEMLAGDYEHSREIPVRPRVLYDRIMGTVSGDTYTRLLAVSSGGTIPDRGLFNVKTANGVKLGEVDEEFTFEARVGDKFLLGTFAWKIESITRDDVVVSQTSSAGAAPPFWKADYRARSLETGMEIGAIFSRLNAYSSRDEIKTFLSGLGADNDISERVSGIIESQKESTGLIPDAETIICERFTDDTGIEQIMVHSVFGKRVNAPLALLSVREAKRETGMDIAAYDDDDGFLLFPNSQGVIPDGLLQRLAIAADDSGGAHDASVSAVHGMRGYLEAILPSTALFSITFRYNLARALMAGVKPKHRTPLWVQRIRAAETLESIVREGDHPLIRETKRECLETLWDIEGTFHIIKAIREGRITVREVETELPSPMSLPLRRAAESVLLYEYTPTPAGINEAVTNAVSAQESKIAPDKADLQPVRRTMPQTEEEWHTKLMIEGDWTLQDGSEESAHSLEQLENLVSSGRAAYIDPGLYIAAEHEEVYQKALETGENLPEIIRRCLMYRGGADTAAIAARYFIPETAAEKAFNALESSRDVILHEGEYYHSRAFESARRKTLLSRRREIETAPPEAYAAYLAACVKYKAPRDEQLISALETLEYTSFPAAQWENVILPQRVTGYSPELLDKILASGEFSYCFRDGQVSFFRAYSGEQTGAGVNPELLLESLTDSQKRITDALSKRGASFLRSLPGGSDLVSDVLNLIERGIIRTDSFAPVRFLLLKPQKTEREARRRAALALKALSGRIELASGGDSAGEGDIETRILRALKRYGILCRETARDCGLEWRLALDKLRLWEILGKVRRGYFVSGLSGAQFAPGAGAGATAVPGVSALPGVSFEKITAALRYPAANIIWLSAADPSLAYGRILPHGIGDNNERLFTANSGTCVCLRAGVICAVAEKSGSSLRLINEPGAASKEIIESFTEAFRRNEIFRDQNKIKLKEYNQELTPILASTGFKREMNDMVLYRS